MPPVMNTNNEEGGGGSGVSAWRLCAKVTERFSLNQHATEMDVTTHTNAPIIFFIVRKQKQWCRESRNSGRGEAERGRVNVGFLLVSAGIANSWCKLLCTSTNV